MFIRAGVFFVRAVPLNGKSVTRVAKVMHQGCPEWGGRHGPEVEERRVAGVCCEAGSVGSVLLLGEREW